MTSAPTLRPVHPHEHLDLAQRRARLKELAAALSPMEQDRWNKAICGSARSLDFDPNTRVPAEIQAEIQQYLAAREAPKDVVSASPAPAASVPSRPRRLSVFDIARLRHGLQKIGSVQDADELTRQVLWSIEAGSLRQFGVMHAVNIALKKIREGQWTRPTPDAAELAAQAERCRAARDLQRRITNKDFFRNVQIQEIRPYGRCGK